MSANPATEPSGITRAERARKRTRARSTTQLFKTRTSTTTTATAAPTTTLTIERFVAAVVGVVVVAFVAVTLQLLMQNEYLSGLGDAQFFAGSRAPSRRRHLDATAVYSHAALIT